MTDQQTFALTHPFGGDNIAPYRTISKQPDGNLLCLILAVDR